MKKQEFTHKLCNEIETCKALLFFAEHLAETVKAYDGKVYSIRLIREFEQRDIRYNENQSGYYKCSVVRKSHTDAPLALKAYFMYTFNGTLRNIFPRDIELSFGESRLTARNKNDFSNCVVDENNRYSYAAFMKAYDMAAGKMRMMIEQKLDAILKADQMEAEYNELVRCINQFRKDAPSEIYGIISSYVGLFPQKLFDE